MDLAGLGWGALDVPQSIETDGDLNTREWLIRPAVDNWVPMYRVVAERNGAACAGPWFTVPSADATPTFLGTRLTVQRVGLVHKLVVRRMGSDLVSVVALDTPVCGSH